MKRLQFSVWVDEDYDHPDPAEVAELIEMYVRRGFPYSYARVLFEHNERIMTKVEFESRIETLESKRWQARRDLTSEFNSRIRELKMEMETDYKD